MPDFSQISDEDLVVQVRNKDKEIYREIVNRYEKKLLRYARRLVRDETTAEDVVQKAFLKAYINLQSFDSKRKFSSWIYRIVHNEAVNWIKKQNRLVHFQSQTWLNWEDDELEGIEEGFQNKEEKEKMFEKIDRLPLKYKEPLLLAFGEGLSYEEISEIMHLPIGTVGTRINRAKQKVRDLMKEK